MGKVVGEYWHPGHLLHLAHVDLDGDGREELLLAGVNNGHHAATLVVFDPSNVSGTADQLTDSRFSSGTSKAPRSTYSFFPVPV